MRIKAICAAAALLFALPAAAQLPAPAACNHAPHQTGAAQSPELMAARRNMHQACAADVATYCSNVPRECGGPMHCLAAHQSELSAGCASAWQNLRAVRAQHG
jgi:hypothetical protein